MTCPRCGSPLATDGITVEAGGVPVSQEWVSGCLSCKWQPGDGFNERQEVPHFSPPITLTRCECKE